jgi:hypothetical protein
MKSISDTPAFSPAVAPSSRVAISVFFVLLAMMTLALSGAWVYVARQRLETGISIENQSALERVRGIFDLTRHRTQAALTTQCRLLAEDPRLKATLSIEGMDEATVADILNDLLKLRGKGFLLVVSADGHVFAQAGAPELRGLDLSASSVITGAKKDTAAGSWVIGRQIMDLAAIPIVSDGVAIAYLVVGQSIDEALLKEIADATGAELGVGLGNEITLTSTTSPEMRALFNGVANDVNRARPRIVKANGEDYVTSFADLDQAQTRPYLVLARKLRPSRGYFQELVWLLFAPIGLVFIALLVARARGKQGHSRNGGV